MNKYMQLFKLSILSGILIANYQNCSSDVNFVSTNPDLKTSSVDSAKTDKSDTSGTQATTDTATNTNSDNTTATTPNTGSGTGSTNTTNNTTTGGTSTGTGSTSTPTTNTNAAGSTSSGTTSTTGSTSSTPSQPQTQVKCPDGTTLNSSSNVCVAFNGTDQQATIAFNDNYPSAGDSDYNDFVTNVKVIENYNNDGSLQSIFIQYTPKVKLSSARLAFILVFDGHVRGRSTTEPPHPNSDVTQAMFDGNANIHYKLIDKTGKIIAEELNHNKATDLVVFPSADTAMNNSLTAQIEITNIEHNLNNTFTSRGGLSIKRYRSLLNNGQYDIDISDINPNPNLCDTKKDSTGNIITKAPSGFFVPVNWAPPLEKASIFDAYAGFKAHADYFCLNKGSDNPNWFSTITNSSLILK